MPMRIPENEKVIQDQRLTVIRAAATLHARASGERSIAEKVKSTMQAKSARFAASDLVNARLQTSNTSGPVSPRSLYALVESGRLTIEQFLQCVGVRKGDLPAHLSTNEIESLDTLTPALVSPSLITEFKSGEALTVPELAQLLIDYWPNGG